jgi:cytochrome c-type protein NapC
VATWTVVIIGELTIILAAFIALRTRLTHFREGKALAFVGLLVLPVIASWFGFEEQMNRAESTRFCLSCHVMHGFGQSLLVDDISYIPAVHYQNNLVPREHACYTCHTDYAMFGTAVAKMHGMEHVLVQYFGTVPKPEDIKLYQPYNNRECLHCHLGSRKFEEQPKHAKSPTMLADIHANKLSCTASKCHDTIHEVGSLKDATFWKGKLP